MFFDDEFKIVLLNVSRLHVAFVVVRTHSVEKIDSLSNIILLRRRSRSCTHNVVRNTTCETANLISSYGCARACIEKGGQYTVSFVRSSSNSESTSPISPMCAIYKSTWSNKTTATEIKRQGLYYIYTRVYTRCVNKIMTLIT